MIGISTPPPPHTHTHPLFINKVENRNVQVLIYRKCSFIYSQNWIFSVCDPHPPTSLVGAYYLQPHKHEPDFYVVIYHVMTRTCSVTGGGCTRYWGNKRKILQNFTSENFRHCRVSKS